MTDSASLLRRAAALLYDTVAVVALVYFAAFVPVLAAGGNAIAPGNPLLLLYVIGTAFVYFALCWARGRTLGMQAWKLEILDERGRTGIGWRTALVRFLGAALSGLALGLGYLWALLDRDQRTWHDRLSRSRIVFRPGG